jgi:hypothetical protein
MSDRDKDWLDEELEGLKDLQAPQTLLPRVMEKVERRAARPAWIRVWARRPDLIRTFTLSFALALLVLLPVLNPLNWASDVIEGSPVVRLGAVLGEVGRSILFETKVGQLPIVAVLATVAFIGYLFCVAAALAVQRLSTARR